LTTTLPDGLVAEARIADAHALLADAQALIARRRALFTAAWRILEAGAPEPSLDILDSPFTRGRLSAGLSYPRSRLRADHGPYAGTAELGRRLGDGRPVLLSTFDAVNVARSSLRAIDRQLERHGDDSRVEMATMDDGGFAAMESRVIEGIGRFEEVLPRVAADVLPHISAIMLLVSKSAARIGSASLRDHPGLVAFPGTLRHLELLEALVHEGAHQKFFDMCLTFPILRVEAYRSGSFRPSWVSVDAPDWSFEQVCAAFHAYLCLAALNVRIGELGWLAEDFGSTSLLARADERSTELGSWISGNEALLGSHGVLLFRALAGREVPHSKTRETAVERFAPESGGVVIKSDDWSVAVTPGDPPSVWWW
jgi:hypothetical protein